MDGERKGAERESAILPTIRKYESQDPELTQKRNLWTWITTIDEKSCRESETWLHTCLSERSITQYFSGIMAILQYNF
jgi:hypothetical protein